MPKKHDHARERELGALFAAAIEPMFDRPSERFQLPEKAAPTPTRPASDLGLLTNDDLIQENHR